MIDSVVLEDLDPLRINVEADLTRGDLHRSPQRYPVTSADALSDRELDRVRAGGVDAQSAELRVPHSTIFVARLEVCSRRDRPDHRSLAGTQTASEKFLGRQELILLRAVLSMRRVV